MLLNDWQLQLVLILKLVAASSYICMGKLGEGNDHVMFSLNDTIHLVLEFVLSNSVVM